MRKMATIHWIGSGGSQHKPHDGDSGTASNWKGGVLPADGDNVDLGGGPNSSAYTVTLNVDTANLNNLTFNSSGGEPTLDVSSHTLTIGNNLTVGNGAITIEGGAIDAWNIRLPQSNGS